MTSRVLPCSARLPTLGLLSLGAVCLGLASVAHARVTQINISSVQSPTFGGASFGSVGTYEVITGTFTDEVDPSDPRNSVITDIALGPKNADGTVSFSADFQIIRPTDLSKGAHRVMYDWPNRGGPGALSTLNAGITAAGTPITAGGNTAVPPSAGTAGTGFLMNMGWSIVEVGWDLTAPQGGKLFGVTLPVAKNKDGSAITGPTTEELVVDLGTTPADLPLTYPPASLDQSKAMLTVRENYGDTPQVVPAAEWTYSTTCTAQTDYFSTTCVKLTAGNFGAPGTFGPTALYEFTYIAQNPNIAGLGLAALRDFATFLRDAKTDDVRRRQPARRRCQRHLHHLQLAALPHDARFRAVRLQRRRCSGRRQPAQMGRSQLVEPVLATPASSRKSDRRHAELHRRRRRHLLELPFRPADPHVAPAYRALGPGVPVPVRRCGVQGPSDPRDRRAAAAL